MSGQIWWYLARASGITAWLFLTASVLWGIVLSTDLFPKHRRPAWLLDLHRALAAFTIGFVGVHVGALVADSYVQFDLVDVVVPFASSWKPWQVAFGVFAIWGLVVVEATSLAMKRIPKRVWRAIHLTFLLTSLHGTFAGTDATHLLYVATSIATTVALVFAVAYRILSRRPPRSAPPSTSRRRSRKTAATTHVSGRE